MSKGSGSALGFWLAAVFSAALIAAMEARAALSEANLRDAQNIVHMLDYVSVDYPEFVRDGQVLNEAEYREQLEFAGQVLALLETLPPPQQADLLAQAAALKRRIEGKAPGEEVSRLASALRWAVIDAYELIVTPKRAPDLSRARTLYAEQCAGCHGAQGRGDGPAASGMDPPPSDFHDQARMASRSVYGLY
ncbi:MAG: cytochrome C, partial [Azospira oryzae]